MGYDDDYFVRFLEEQRRFDDLLKRAMGADAIHDIFAQIGPIQQNMNQMSSTFQSTMHAGSEFGFLAHDQVHRGLVEQQKLIDQARGVWPDQIRHFALEDKAIQAYLDQERLLISLRLGGIHDTSYPCDAIQESIDKALKFTQGLDFDHLLGLSPDSLLQQLDPLKTYLKQLEEIYRQIDLPEKEAEPDSVPVLDRAKVIAGLKILDHLFDRVCKFVLLWLALNSSSSIDQSQLDRIESSVVQLAEHQQTVSVLYCDLSEGHELSYSVTTTKVFLRTGPSVENEDILLLSPGSRFLVTRERDGWSAGLALIGDENPIPGWVSSDFLVPLTAKD